MSPTPEPQSWHRTVKSTHYTITTSPTHLSHTFINHAFAQPEMFWATPLAPADLETMLANSLTLGLYTRGRTKSPSDACPGPTVAPSSAAAAAAPNPTADTEEQQEELTQIGLARLITDRCTTAYLTDVYVAPAHQHRGLATWLVQCVRAVMEGMPALRRALLLAEAEPGGGTGGAAVRFYERVLGCRVLEQGNRVVVMTRGPVVDGVGGE